MAVSRLLLLLGAAALLKLVIGLTIALIWRRRQARRGVELAYHLDPGRQQIHDQHARAHDRDVLVRAGAS